MDDNINACFISYRHTNDPDAHCFVKAFVRQLRKQLAWWLPNAPVFFDEEGLKVGDQFNQELAYQLCRSACMVMFFSPLHFDVYHPYCALEYKAMLELEQRRLGHVVDDLRNKGLIFPVVFRGLDCLPVEIKDQRNYENLDHIIVESDFEQRDCQQRLNELAKQIFRRYMALHQAGVFANNDCVQFCFPAKAAVMPWLERISQIRLFVTPGH
ncbi:MAG: toll/interleukin-1 receptor domain-containing protein [Candidatus Contendobacter sp.]|nr:toll/interleukin-1 receptor domain-containing protein [Candidatus Contendobacter sp.]